MELEQNYFDKMYAKGSTIDGDFNAKSHVKYLKSMFDLMEYPITSIIDFGFGKANLLKEALRAFRPKFSYGIDNSRFAFDLLCKQAWIQDWDLRIQCMSISDWEIAPVPVDLGICNSVFQYIPDQDLEKSLMVLAYSCKYLYFHVPSAEDYSKLKTYYGFEDPWAIQRENAFYKERLSEYFVSVSWGLMESRFMVDEENSPFFDSLYRL